ncbi:hypothetical protein TIFTF001_022384 [Ficus carica]|uniref:Uncharacterized protein n=2 Tax=Ficus carica TaxID=3494 RepID=A0AA88DFG9_FICCA|nr:hypothetical protein TIFTF001_022384 [Ficus carica]
MPMGGESLMVADLMSDENRIWDKDKIENTLWPVDHELILGIPLGNAAGGDKWAWHFDSKGLYKVRSGYRAIMESKRRESSSIVNSDVFWWRKLWSSPIPPKVRLFVWRAFHEILPTMVSLRIRGVDCDVICPRCKDVMESTSHAILDCPISQMVWKMSRFWKVIESRKAMPFADLLRVMPSVVPMEDFALICWLAWKLWGERNKVVHGGEAGDPQAIFELSIASYGEWQVLNRAPTLSQAVGSDVWEPPQPGYLKLNIDASVFPRSDHIGIGVAIRDEKGSILGAVAKSVEGSFSPFVAECLALREGLRFAKEIECANLEVETDAINVVSAVVDNRELSMEGPIMEDIKLLFSQLQITGIHHICRSANHVAHLLARFGFNSNCTNVWISETPTVVSNAVSIDAIA